MLKKQTTERGPLLIKKPGKMRWEYTVPEEKSFVSDGVKIYSYIPAGQAGHRPVGSAETKPTMPALFLAGKGNLTRDFTPSLADARRAAPPATAALKLGPESPQPDYDWLILRRRSRRRSPLRGLVTADAQGGTSTLFLRKSEGKSRTVR